MIHRLLTLFIVLTALTAAATHERAGEITYRNIGGLTYEIRILTYTFAPSPADRPELEIKWGDGTSSILPRVEKVDLANDIRRNVYVGTHTYSGPSTYLLTMEDPNRNYGVLNIPNSVNVPFFTETKLVINPFIGPNSSPVLLNPPIDQGCIGTPFIHNAGAYDAEGDSLAYRFVICKGAYGQEIPGYVFPNVVDQDNPPGDFSINPTTGDIVWDSPSLQGEYNFAFQIEEWRNGVLISAITRDMQVEIAACNNTPPVIDVIPDTCITAGSTLNLTVRASDADNDKITLTATGGPLVVANSPAVFDQPDDSAGHVTAPFTWNTTCAHILKRPWSVYFKATDDGYPVRLVDIKTLNILVISPPPENLTAVSQGNAIYLQWDECPCSNAAGYRIYRRFGPSGFQPGPCETGVPPYTGFEAIAEVSPASNTFFIDDNNGTGLVHGIQYCYLVIALFPDGAESFASNEACAALKKDVPIITHVSVENTAVSNGTNRVAWSKPTEIDFEQAPGPYRQVIFYSADYLGTGAIPIDTLDNLNDTIYYHQPVNTQETPSSYRIDLYNNTPGNYFLIGSSQTASSVFLEFVPSDNSMLLSWTEFVPWQNTGYTIFHLNENGTAWDSVGFSETTSFADTGLLNGITYCYYVKSIGRYSTPGVIDPIINLSQMVCGTPLDNVPPCPPVLTVTSDCNVVTNFLSWTNPNNYCCDDVMKYYIYFTPTLQGDFLLLDSTQRAGDTTYLHQFLLSIAGCYAVTAIDSTGNESLFSNVVCVSIDGCPLFQLPNVFTPNGDGFNDYLRPYPYTSVERIDVQIFNRWGEIVYETSDPDINWDGKHMQTGQDCSEGVYFYVCDVYEITLEGVVKRSLQGVVHLYR